MAKITKAQFRALTLIADRLPFYGSFRDWRGVRSDVRDRLWIGGYISTPNMNRESSRKWELTDAGRQALQKDQTP